MHGEGRQDTRIRPEGVRHAPAHADAGPAGQHRTGGVSHEYGHLVLGHWDRLVGLYRHHIPGEVRPDTTDPVAQALGRDGAELSHRQEFEADAFGFRLAQQLGVGLDEALSLLMRRPAAGDTPTHPATRRRIAQLRMLQAREAGSDPAPLRSATTAAAPAATQP